MHFLKTVPTWVPLLMCCHPCLAIWPMSGKNTFANTVYAVWMMKICHCHSKYCTASSHVHHSREAYFGDTHVFASVIQCLYSVFINKDILERLRACLRVCRCFYKPTFFICFFFFVFTESSILKYLHCLSNICLRWLKLNERLKQRKR